MIITTDMEEWSVKDRRPKNQSELVHGLQFGVTWTIRQQQVFLRKTDALRFCQASVWTFN